MQQLLQHLGNGTTEVVEVPAPGPASGALLIRTTRSLISAGTERMLVDFGKAGWLGKARQQPEKVRAVFDKIRSAGLTETLRAIRSKLAQPIPLGYCQVGVVVDAGSKAASLTSDFAVGDRVVSNGSHAEVVSVSHHLCAKIPASVSDDAATFTPLAAIALEGINLLGPSAGDKVVVTGLGLIGQLAVRILKAKGCEVLGIDPSAERRKLAEQSGAITAEGDPVVAALSWTNGVGVAGVLITASTSSNEVANQAARSCRRRGRVVLVGVVGLQLNRADFYRQEISFQVSCSYGTRDGQGEDSARRNFEQVLAWMADGRLPVEDLITHRFEFAAAADAYGALADRSSLGILLRYPTANTDSLRRTIELPRVTGSQVAGPGVALVGAGNFALRTLLPAWLQIPRALPVVTVVSRQGAAALIGARAANAPQATTDFAAALANPNVRAVILTTRHDSHAAQALAALRAGKHVWVEKPLCLADDELAAISNAISVENAPVLTVGFNRRFSPVAVTLRRALAERPKEKWHFEMVVNAGRLPVDHWTLDPHSGGGRIVGEACHFVDLMRFLAGSSLTEVECTRRDSDGQDGAAFQLKFADGSFGTIDYRTDLPAHVPKEMIRVSGEGAQAEIQNWSRLSSRGLGGVRGGRSFLGAPRKGHREALQSFLSSIESAVPPIPRDELIEVSRWSIIMQAMHAGQVVRRS